MQLREYQLNAIEQIREHIRRGKKHILLVAPTGSGKTVIAAEMIRSADAHGSKKLFLAHRRELISQCGNKLASCGVEFGIIQAQNPNRKPWLTTHICSVQTLTRRSSLPKADIVFIDEAHRAGADSYRKIIASYPDAIVVGLTATPIRDSGRGLGDLFQAMVECPPMQELTDMGFLVPSIVYAPARPDLSGVRTVASEYQNDELARVMDKATLIGDAVIHWKKLCAGRLGVCFAVNIAHSKHIVEQFRAAGVLAEHLDGTLPDSERDAVLERLRSGATRVVSNCAVLTEGWDFPEASAVLLCRPTKSLGLWLQMVGRVLRPAGNKSNAIILDHSGMTFDFGLPADPRNWRLDYQKKRKSASDLDPALSVRMCLQCWAAFSSTLAVCPMCGWTYVGKNTQPEVVEGELEEITPENRPAYTIRKLSNNPVVAALQQTAAEKGYRPGWVHFQLSQLRKKQAGDGMPKRMAASGPASGAADLFAGEVRA